GPAGVAREDAVLGHRLARARVEHGGRGHVAARVAAHPDRAAPVAAVPPDLVAGLARRAGEIVADREVLDRRAARLEDLDPVAGREVLPRRIGGAGCGGGAVAAVHEHEVAVHAAQVNAGRGDEHARVRAGLPGVDAGPDGD